MNLRKSGFTLIELIMVILLVGILAAVAIPQFQDFRVEAKDEATKGALGGLRSAVAVMVAAIALKEDPALTPATYPTYAEFNGNAMLAAAPNNHAVLAGTAIMDPSAGIPNNAWTDDNAMIDCDGDAIGTLQVAPNDDTGWCYNETAGTTWANSDLSTGGTTENNF